MTKVSLTVNGCLLSAEVEPRTHLGDLLRETHNLTGTRLRARRMRRLHATRRRRANTLLHHLCCRL
jgi:aerobic-type carbon monoxide dehydrogenase small subunit (CoxS/CutS family)